jgi:hypothetical protein
MPPPPASPPPPPRVAVEVGTRMLEVGRHLRWMDETPPGTTSSAAAMHALIERQGYMLLRDLVPREAVADGCRCLAATLAAGGWLAPGRDPELLELGAAPPNGGFMLAASEQDEMMNNPAVRRVLAGPELMGLFERLFGEEPATFAFKWFRAMCPGQSSGFHVDKVYMGKGSPSLVSVWIPWHDVDVERGGLVVLERSNSSPAHARLRETYGEHDYEHSRIDTGQGNTVANSGWYTRDPAELLALEAAAWRKDDQEQEGASGGGVGGGGCCWRTAEQFNAGDVVVFPMQTMHGTVTNTTHTPALLRLSCDIRFQPRADEVDPRHTLQAAAAAAGGGGGKEQEQPVWDRDEFLEHGAAHAAAAPLDVPLLPLAEAKRQWGLAVEPLPGVASAPPRALVWPPVPWRQQTAAAAAL